MFAASRAYIPTNIWEEVKNYMAEDLKEIKVGDVQDFTNFVNAVIDERSFDKLAKYIDDAAQSPDAEIILGGKCDKSTGYFIHPTDQFWPKSPITSPCAKSFSDRFSPYMCTIRRKWKRHWISWTIRPAMRSMGAIFSLKERPSNT